MSDVFTYRAKLGAPPSAVYQAITDADAVRVWLSDEAEISLPDRVFQFWGRSVPDGEPGRQRLIAAQPERGLSFSWLIEGDETTAEITLEPDSGGTVLTFTQTGMPTWQELVKGEGKRDRLHNFWTLSFVNLANHVEGRELVSRCDFRPQDKREARVEADIAASPDQVFASIIEPDELNRWFASDARVDPRVGGELAYSAKDEPYKILELEPGRVLATTWRWGGQDTVARWELEGSEGKTHLTVTHSGFSKITPNVISQHEAGWLGVLAGLKRMHEIEDWQPNVLELSFPGQAR